MKLPNFRFVLFLSNIYYVSTFLLSWQRFAYGIEDTETVKQQIDLRAKLFEEVMLTSSEVFPATFRSKRFQSKRHNFLEQNPRIWHCSTCKDTNPSNPFLHSSIGMSAEDDEVIPEFATSTEQHNTTMPFTTTIPLAAVSTEPHIFPPGLNETELIKSLDKGEIEHLVEDFYYTQAYALIPAPSSVVQHNPIAATEVIDVKHTVEDDTETIEQELTDKAEKSKSANKPEEDSMEVLDILDTVVNDSPNDLISSSEIELSEPNEVLMSQGQEEESFPLEISEKDDNNHEHKQHTADERDSWKEQQIVEAVQDNKEKGSEEEIIPFGGESSDEIDDYEDELPDLIPKDEVKDSNLVFLMASFLAGVLFTGLFTFAVYSLYRYWITYPARFINWLERRITKLFDERKYEQVISDINLYLPEVKRLKGANHIDTCAFKHYMARAYIALSNGKPALELLQEVLNAYQPFGEDVYLAQVYEDIGISQHNLEEFGEALLNLQTALKIFTEEYSCESGDWKRKSSESTPAEESEKIDMASTTNKSESPTDSALNFDYSAISSPEIVVVDGPFTPFAKYDDKEANLKSNFTDNIYSDDQKVSQSLEDAFISQVDLNSALKELEDLLADGEENPIISSSESLQSTNSSPTKTKLFKELQEVAHIDIARVCKELGDVYNDIKNYEEALVFYKNALDVLLRLMTEDTPQVQCLKTLVKTTQINVSKDKAIADVHKRNPKSSPTSVAYFAAYQTKSEEILIPLK